VANGQSCDTCPSPNDLAVIDGASGSVTGVIPLGASPGAMAVDTQTNFIYVVSGGKVTVINGATNTTTALTDPNAKNPVAIATNSVANKIYVANSGSNNVTVIDGAHN
jgi:DNA-binding beta-propeller fold protein YncE